MESRSDDKKEKKKKVHNQLWALDMAWIWPYVSQTFASNICVKRFTDRYLGVPGTGSLRKK